MTDNDERWLPELLRDHGYRGQMRQQGWFECLVWRGEERWLGHGADAQAALAHLLAQMFPSTVARALFERQAPSATLDPALPATSDSAADLASKVPDNSSATPSPAPTAAPPHAVLHPAATPAATPATTPATTTTTPAEPERRPFEPPRVGERLILPTPTYPAAAIAEARETLEDILKEIADARPDFALMAPRLQKVHMLGWICRARGLDEQYAGEHKVAILVRRVAHELTNISKIMWPGSVQALQMNARPDCVVSELGVKSAHIPRTWNDASEFVQTHRERAMHSDVPLDDYGWADDLRRPTGVGVGFGGDARQILRDAQVAVEALAGPAQEPPPRHISTPPEDLGQDTIDALVKHVQLLRAIRIHSLQPELWGCVMGRLRWLSGRLGDRAPTLRKWLDPEFRPPVDTSRAAAAQNEQLRQRQVAVRSEREQLSAATAPATLGVWLLKAFDAFNTPDVAALVGDLRGTVVDLDDDALPDADRRLRRRLRDLKSHLRNAPESDEPELEHDYDSIKIDLTAPEGPAEEVADDSLAALVRARVRGKSALFVSNRDDPDLKAKLEDQLGLDISWCDGNPRKVQAQCESIARRSYDLVLIATGFQAHTIDGILARAARAGGVPYVRVFKGRPLACVRALARSLGMNEA